ncbi:Uncharacterised protein [Burkholderia pseudomallei]|uniref:hypothetical protein n=1 Tax=Burkholderia pseudomallei TaxID=28450 RepID=UPI000976F018|nr:hypothetical protein [Burkholderia pseudomallei]OMS02432.1 hypothetical protein AQ734_05465 [Burkholderia pseudomallei]CAJ2904475.1 Uncharacterised protein [Burkholderia pseudomallei]CAJ3276023.1 Uncharacterised protein [Burkholderia pseudomallei]CAJ3457220.1 Uncharacterised protein [Burkholderia pseudomallei]CAJ3680042.1 Uncharacterised protein [Burkholderia pseudomallei]
MDLLASMWRNGTARGAVILFAMILSMRWFPATATKLFGAGLMLLFAINLYREWKTYVRPTRTLYAIYGIRTRRFLKRIKRVPPDVPFLYGIALMLATVWMALMAFQASGAPMISFGMVFGGMIAIAALRQVSTAIRTLVKLTWSRTIGKITYAGALSIAYCIGRGDAIATARELTHADAKYFPTFIGFMSGPYTILRMLQFASLLMVVCAVLALLAAWPRAIGRMLRCVVLVRVRPRPRNVENAEPILPDALSFFTPVGLVFIAICLVKLPESAISMLQRYELPAHVLARTEYVDDGACKNIPAGVRTQHLGDSRVSVLKYNGQTPEFSQAACERVP